MSAIGVMAMPADFRYRDVFLKGKPQHDRYDTFRIRHPRMDTGHRAKIFSPFDALKGFNEAVISKNVLYRGRISLEKEARDELDRRLHILHNLTYNGRMARQNRVSVTVTFFVLCQDEDHEAYGVRGQYQTISGICWKVDPELLQAIQVDRKTIAFDDILRIESPDGVFDKDWIDDISDWERGDSLD